MMLNIVIVGQNGKCDDTDNGWQ